MRIISAILITLALASCAGIGANQNGEPTVLVSNENMVKNCAFLGNVSGVSSFYGIFASQAYASARKIAMQEAHKLKATNIVLSDGNSNSASTIVSGKAYLCKQ